MISGTWPRARDKTRDDIQYNLQSDTAFMQPFFKHHLALIDSNRKRDYLFFFSDHLFVSTKTNSSAKWTWLTVSD